MSKTEFVGHILQYEIRVPKFILKSHLILKSYMETLRHHDARLEQNRVREIREVFISLRQLIRVVTTGCGQIMEALAKASIFHDFELLIAKIQWEPYR